MLQSCEERLVHCSGERGLLQTLKKTAETLLKKPVVELPETHNPSSGYIVKQNHFPTVRISPSRAQHGTIYNGPDTEIT